MNEDVKLNDVRELTRAAAWQSPQAQAALHNQILRCEVGSGSHGLALEGKDDHDEMGVFIEPPAFALGFNSLEHYIYRDAGGSNPSRPGDLDLTLYSLNKFLRLAMQGNPSVLLLLYGKPLFVDPARYGEELRLLRDKIISKEAGPRFRGYLRAQRERITGERGSAKVPKRGDGHAKYASHMLRLGFQGIEFLKTGMITLPMPLVERQMCRSVKQGETPLKEALLFTEYLEEEMARVEKDSHLRDKPDREFVEKWMIRTYQDYWRWKRWW